MIRVALLTAAITTGLTAGLFYGYSCSVMPGVRRVDARGFVDAVRAINVAILNGRFAPTVAAPTSRSWS